MQDLIEDTLNLNLVERANVKPTEINPNLETTKEQLILDLKAQIKSGDYEIHSDVIADLML